MLSFKNFKIVENFLSKTTSVLKFSQINGIQHRKSGDSIKVKLKIKQSDVDNFSNLTGDHNPIHKPDKSILGPVVQGAFLNGLVSGVIGTKFPGPGSMVLSQRFSFPNKCLVNKDLDIIITLMEVRKIMKISYECRQDGIVVFEGDAKIIQKQIN